MLFGPFGRSSPNHISNVTRAFNNALDEAANQRAKPKENFWEGCPKGKAEITLWILAFAALILSAVTLFLLKP